MSLQEIMCLACSTYTDNIPSQTNGLYSYIVKRARKVDNSGQCVDSLLDDKHEVGVNIIFSMSIDTVQETIPLCK